MVVAGLGLVATGVVVPVDLKEGELGTPVAGFLVGAAISWGLLLGADALVRRLALKVWWARAGAAITALAAVAVPVMLSHAVVLYLLDTPPAGRLPDLVLVMTVPWALALWLARTPLAPYLIGAPRTVGRAAKPAAVVVPQRRQTLVVDVRNQARVVRIPGPRSPVADRRFI